MTPTLLLSVLVAAVPALACDDGATDAELGGDEAALLDSAPTAFRLTRLEIRDPHVFAPLGPFCLDMTAATNGNLASFMSTVGSSGSYLMSPTIVMRPLAQTAPTMSGDLQYASCKPATSSAPLSCSPGARWSEVGQNQATGTCLGALPGTTRGYLPGVSSTTGPCFATAEQDLLPVPIGSSTVLWLRHARLSARYLGNPATQLGNGLVRGFLTEGDAAATVLPANVPIVGGRSLASLLAGGAGACSAFSDKDSVDGFAGWWVYLSYDASAVAWSETAP